MRSSIPASLHRSSPASSPRARWRQVPPTLLLPFVLFVPLLSLPLLSGQEQPKGDGPITFELQVIKAERQKPSFELRPRAPRYAPPRANLLRPNFRARVIATAALVD